MVNSTAHQLPTDIQFEKQLGQLTAFVRVMRQAGLPIEEALQKPIDDPEMRKRLVRFWLSGGYEATTSQKRAREIMGRNIFGVEEAITHFGVNPLKIELVALAEISFTEATLESCRETHILVAVFPLSILDIRNKVHGGRRLFYDQSWYDKESFAMDKGDVSWQLICRTPVVNSTDKTWSEQQALLGKNEETPTARVMVYTTIGHFLATGERLFEKIYIRCLDVTSGGGRVYVGDFGESGLRVYGFWDDGRVCDVGVAASRKF